MSGIPLPDDPQRLHEEYLAFLATLPQAQRRAVQEVAGLLRHIVNLHGATGVYASVLVNAELNLKLSSPGSSAMEAG